MCGAMESSNELSHECFPLLAMFSCAENCGSHIWYSTEAKTGDTICESHLTQICYPHRDGADGTLYLPIIFK